MKRMIALLLACMLILEGCAQNNNVSKKTSKEEQTNVSDISDESLDVDKKTDASKNEQMSTAETIEDDADDTPYEYKAEFDSLDDPELLRYVEDNLYSKLVSELNSDDYFVENVSAAYLPISKEYLEEVAYNSQPNIYFGYTLEEIDQQFQGTRYVFTLGENGETIVQPYDEYDEAYEEIIKNVAVGMGVILIGVTVSGVSAGAGAHAVSMIFATAAKTGTTLALKSGAFGGIAAGVVTGLQTHDMEQAIKEGALVGSEAFKWGAITGTVSGGADKAVALKGATLNGLTMNEAAKIQKESGYPLDVITQFHTTKEYDVFKSANLKSVMINGKTALVRADIDLNYVDELGHTNLERMRLGLPALDSNGKSYELHHIGQKADGTLAILSQKEHDSKGLHGFKTESEIKRSAFAKQRKEFWKTMAELLENGGI